MTNPTNTTLGNPLVAPAADGLLTKHELAERLRVSSRTVDVYMRNKRLPFLKIGKTVRFRWTDVLEKLCAHRVN
jgi:excisionase family DNA binding protein